MITAWILLSPALAQDDGHAQSETAADVACFAPSLTDHRPVDGQVDVPLDAALMLVFDGDGCINNVQVTVTSPTATVFDDSVTLDQDEPVTLLEGLALAPDEIYTLLAVVLGYTEEEGQSFRFTTGSDSAQVPSAPPTVQLYDVLGTPSDRVNATWDAELHVSATPVPSGLSFVEVMDVRSPATTIATAFVPGTGELELAARWVDTLTEEEICLQARQTDATGTPGTWGEPDCMVPAIDDSDVDWSVTEAEGCGCSGSPAPAPGWALLLPLVGLARRRAG